MDIQPLWSLLGIIIALTAYIVAVRRRVLDKTKETGADKNSLFKYARLLMIADVPLVASGFVIAVHNILLVSQNQISDGSM